jgi:choline trimethylamine-lyase
MGSMTSFERYGSTPRIQRLRNQYTRARVDVSLDRALTYTRVYQQTAAEPMVLRRAKAFKAYCNTKPIRIGKDELIVASAGDRPRVAVICPEIHASWFDSELETVSTRPQDPYYLDDADKAVWQKDLAPFWKDKTIFDYWYAQVPAETKRLSYDTGVIDCLLRSENGPGFQTPGFEEIAFKKGFNGIKQDARKKLRQLDPADPDNYDKRNFLNAVIISCEGMSLLGSRHARLADALADREKNRKRKEELKKIAAVCRRIPSRPPTNFHEAVQMVWFVMMAIQMEAAADSVAVGRFDQFMYPYYRHDMDNKTLTKAKALELIENLWLNLYGNIWPLSEAGAFYYSGYHPFCALTIGGVTPDGRDATNDLSYLCIDATINLKVTQPSLGTRVYKQSPQKFLLKNAELVREGLGFPAFHNDEPAIKMLLKKGVSMDEARNWNTLGCVEPSLAGKLHQWTASGNYNFASAVEFALFNGRHIMSGKQLGIKTGDPLQFDDFETFKTAVEKQLAYIIKQHAIATTFIERIHRDHLPCALISSLCLDCVENGKELMQGGARYNIGPGNLGIGLTDCANSLAAVKKLVYDEKKVGWVELLDVLKNDFANDGRVRKLLLKAPKWGNDDDYADDFGREITDIMVKEHHRYKTLTGKYLMPALLPVSSNVPMGQVVWALPSGRKAYEPLADGISPNHGTDKLGPTAVLKSVSKLNHEDVDGGTLLNMKFDPKTLAGAEGLEHFVAFIRTFVDLGVYHVQFNVVDKETLVAAQKNPEAHRSLMVRVAGYSAYFVELCPEIQNDIIGRTAHEGL